MPPTPCTRAGSAATAIFAALLEQRTGQQLAADREWRIEVALSPLLRDAGVPSLDALAGLVVAGHDRALSGWIVDALLNGESSFFRDPPAFSMIAAAVEQRLRTDPDRPVRLWSAGCSTGQEPLSLAMLLDDRGFATATRIVASDVSATAIARARTGRYSQFEVQRGLPTRTMLRWFEQRSDDWFARPALLSRIEYRRESLAHGPLPLRNFDLILCRNVLLYFSTAMKRVVLNRLRRMLAPDGLLVLGAGETLIGTADGFTVSDCHRGAYRAAETGAALARTA